MAHLIFDYDGTLHETNKIYAPALRRAYANLVAGGYAPLKNMSDAEISRWLGWSTRDMWDEFLPDLPNEIKQNCAHDVGLNMEWMAKSGEAHLYEGALDVLSKLKQEGYTLIFLSNCDTAYMQLHKKIFELDKYFAGFYCTGLYNYAPKSEVFEHIKSDFGEPPQTRLQTQYVAIGDRFHDINFAQNAGLKSIGCTYGYGRADELQKATIKVNDIRDIPKALHVILSNE